MSYILDALKKSEQERGHGSVPGVQTIHSSSLNYHNEKKSIWPVLLFTLVFINIAVLVYFIFTKQPEIITTSQQLATNDNVTQAIKVADSLNTQHETPAQPIALTSADKSASPYQATTKNEDIVHDEISSTSSNKHAKNIEQYTDTISLHDLPQNVRQHIPAMEFSAHIYSTNASRRSLMINGRFMEEGDSVANDLVLSEITSDGAIFDFQGHRFRASVLSGWDIN